MPSRFSTDLSAAAARAGTDSLHGITSVKRGDLDGELVVKYTHSSLESPLQVRLICQDVDSYPESSSFIIFTDDDNAPEELAKAMTDLQNFAVGWRIPEAITALASALDQKLRPVSAALTTSSSEAGDEDVEMTEPEYEDDDDEDSEMDYDDDIDFDDEDDYVNDFVFGLAAKPAAQSRPGIANKPQSLDPRLRRDLRSTKTAGGFKISLLCAAADSASYHIISMAIRACHLGLPEETLQAWDIKTTDHIILLCRIEGLYTPFEVVCAQPAANSRMSFCLGKSERYKPTLAEALDAFAELRRLQNHSSDGVDQSGEEIKGAFSHIALSKSLNQFMNDSFVSMLKLRFLHGISWDEANTQLRSQVGIIDHQQSRSAAKAPDTPESIPSDDHLPAILRRDHMEEGDGKGSLSILLLAMQFAMRFFVGCTKYCVICHRKLDEKFEALKPFVCSSPLCLFQYVSLGFGPSIEHEVLVQPLVVDLLVSFCYSAIQTPIYTAGMLGWAIREFPVGLRLKVPNLETSKFAISGRLKLGRDGVQGSTEFILDSALHADRLREGQWVAFRGITPPAANKAMAELGFTSQYQQQLPPIVLRHAKIHSFDPKRMNTVLLDYFGSTGQLPNAAFAPAPVATAVGLVSPAKVFPDMSDYSAMEMVLYDTDFDGMEDVYKVQVMMHVLDTLPPIADIKDFLESHRHATVKSFSPVSPAAASLLGWIVASNRSCIFQTDSGPTSKGSHSQQTVPSGSGVSGMEGWTAFRFAQGSPDKELRFNSELQRVQASKNLKTPTIFAWHGSNLRNWHSIVRTGLDYKVTTNGRAYGNGVYFSKDFNTSKGYCGGHLTTPKWRKSSLAINCAISLNEVINSPSDFQSQNPHYVVAQENWHQCRFLFVQTTVPTTSTSGHGDKLASKDSKQKSEDGVEYFQEDPGMAVSGPNGKGIQIPLALMPSSRRPGQALPGAARQDGAGDMSEEEDAEDLKIMFSEDDDDEDLRSQDHRLSASSSVDTLKARILNENRPVTPAHINHNVTEFKAGFLDLSTLPRLDPPSWATPTALKHLSNEVKRLQALQNKTPAHELGWHVDFANLENLFQWIVELHSFDLALPLGQDMVRMGVPSVVCELRFGAEFPMTPPFVRVIRPRFLPFASGGGGHVTAGGAMCMELLTTTGWLPSNSLESVLLQIRLALCSLDPKPARLQPGYGASSSSKGKQRADAFDYGIGEAVEAYQRAARVHGWQVPKDLLQTGLGFAAKGAAS